jgi:hypothetical protein
VSWTSAHRPSWTGRSERGEGNDHHSVIYLLLCDCAVYRAPCWEEPCAQGGMLCSHHHETAYNFILEFVFFK